MKAWRFFETSVIIHQFIRNIVPGDTNLLQQIFQYITLFFISRALIGLDNRVYGYACEIFVVCSL